MKVTKEVLEDLYFNKNYSTKNIAKIFKLSETGINYWFRKYKIPKRSISQAIYLHKNPEGDPFSFKKPKNIEEAILFGLGLGLYWGEGNKRNNYGVRLGNVDPYLIKTFIKFLEEFYGVDKKKFRFGLQIFSDTNPKETVRFWKGKINISNSQLQKVIITPKRGVGNYKHKSENGVLTVQFYNKKLRNIIINEIEKLKKK